MFYIIWATSWQNLLFPYANNKGADQPAHLRSLISAFVVHCLDSIIPQVSISEISSLYLASLAAQAGLCLTWLQTPKTGFLVTRLMLSCTFIFCRWFRKHYLTDREIKGQIRPISINGSLPLAMKQKQHILLHKKLCRSLSTAMF